MNSGNQFRLVELGDSSDSPKINSLRISCKVTYTTGFAGKQLLYLGFGGHDVNRDGRYLHPKDDSSSNPCGPKLHDNAIFRSLESQ